MLNHPFFSQKTARRAKRQNSFDAVRTAVRSAASGGWDLKERLNGDAFGRPSTLPETIKKVIASVRTTLDSLGEFPVPPVIEYHSVRSVRAAAGGTERNPLIADGVVMLHARFITKTGVRDEFDIPVMIREGQVVQPSVIMHGGTLKVLAPSSVREMVASGTFTQQAPSRGQFSGPLSHDEAVQWNRVERNFKTRTRLNPGMFSVSSALLRAAVQGDHAFEHVQQRIAQLGAQPGRASMGFSASPGTRVGDRIVTQVSWDPERVEGMGDANLQHAIRSYVLELGTKKEWRDWGTVADIQVDGFDREDGSARVSFKSSEISAPQLSSADFEDLDRTAFSVTAAWCEKCQVTHRSTTKCPHANQSAPGSAPAVSAPAPKESPASKPKATPKPKAALPARDRAAMGKAIEQAGVSPEKRESVMNGLMSLAGKSRFSFENFKAATGEGSLLAHKLVQRGVLISDNGMMAFVNSTAEPVETHVGEGVQLAKQTKPADSASPLKKVDWVRDNLAEAVASVADARNQEDLDYDAAEGLVSDMVDTFNTSIADISSSVSEMPEGKEKARAVAITNSLTGLDARDALRMNKNNIRDFFEPLGPRLDELSKLVGGQQMLFARRQAAIGPSQDETHLEPAERDRSGQFHIGDEVTLTKGQLLRTRGGGTETIPKGTVGRVVGDIFGDGLNLKVVFEDVSPQQVVIPASHVRRASITASTGVTAEKIITEIANLRQAGYSPIDAILTTRKRYGGLGEVALKQAKTDGLLDW